MRTYRLPDNIYNICISYLQCIQYQLQYTYTCIQTSGHNHEADKMFIKLKCDA